MRVGLGRLPALVIIRGVFDMSQFPHLGMTRPPPGNPEQINRLVCDGETRKVFRENMECIRGAVNSRS